MTSRLSQELIAYVNDLDQDCEGFLTASLSPEERADALDSKTHVKNIAKVIVLSREIIALDQLSQITSWIQNHKDTAEHLLDEHYTIQQLENVTSLVRRTLQLSELNARDTPSGQTNRYVMEATRAYIYGFQLASIAMSRAALEQGLKERLGKQGDGGFYELRSLIAEAKRCNLLNATSFCAAKSLAKKGHSVLHESPIKDEEGSLEILIGVRSILEEIYSADGHY